MTIQEITQQTDIEESIKILKDGKGYGNKIVDLKKQFDVMKHKTFDTVLRPNREVYKEENGKEVFDKWEFINRVAFPFQKRITKSSVSFTFGNPVKLNCQPKDEKEKQVLDIIDRILYDNKIDSFNRKIAHDLFASTEVAEIWFTTATDVHTTYGFDSKLKLKTMKVSPWTDSELFPYFSETGDLIAFSRAYSIKNSSNKEILFFDVYTSSEIASYKKEDEKWVENRPTVANPIKKIPVIFATQEMSEWADVQNAIDRLEELLSNFGETNNYHASPKIFVQGKLVGMVSRGDAGGIIEGETGSTAEYLSWNHATDAVKLEIETLLKFIHSLTQTPDVSFESLKDLNQVSGVALRMLFMDAHLKVQEKREVLDEYLQRRINVILSYISMMKTDLKLACESIQIKPEIVPYIIDDVKSQVEILTTANAGKAIISQKTAMEKSGLVADTETEWELLQEEQAQEQQEAIGSTVM